MTEIVCALGFILPAVFVGSGGGAVRSCWRGRRCCGVGMVSYGVYLWQAAAIDGVADLSPLGKDFTEPSLWWVPAGFAACIAAGALSWYVLERPVLDLRRLVPRGERHPRHAPGGGGDHARRALRRELGEHTAELTPGDVQHWPWT